MDCRDCLRLLADYADGILSENFLRDLEGHLARCPKCSVELLLLKKINDALKTQELTEAPPGFTGRLMSRLPPVAEPAVAAPLWSSPWVAGWGTAVLMLGVALTLFRGETRSVALFLSSNLVAVTQNAAGAVLEWLGGALSLPPFPSISPQVTLIVGVTVLALFTAWSSRFVARALTVLRK